MRLAEILHPECVTSRLKSTTKREVIFELVDLIADVAKIDDREQLRDAVWHRELTRTTGIGQGVAIPHGKISCCNRLWMAVGKANPPIEFESLDGKPVTLVILLVSPVDQPGPHIQVLAQISHMLADKEFCAAIGSAETPEDIYDLIAQQEAKAPV